MEIELNTLMAKLKVELTVVTSLDDFNSLYLSVFGQKGEFAVLAALLKALPIQDKPQMGKLFNQTKNKVEELFKIQKTKLLTSSTSGWFDYTKPAINPLLGHLHLVTTAIDEITKIFERIGFSRQRYFEVDWEWYAFESLNMSKTSPARDDFETFFVDQPANQKFGKVVLSPHTSSGQVREMERMGKPPIRMINIAKCYRPNWDLSHVPMFHQFEGLVVDKGINITNLKGTIEFFAGEFFGKDRKTRLRPFHFQFTEPSFELDITCGLCAGVGCKLCKEGWLELGGCGMVHPNVLTAGNINPSIYTGFAFGWGVERVFMMKEGLKIDDLRLLYSNDIRFLEQF